MFRSKNRFSISILISPLRKTNVAFFFLSLFFSRVTKTTTKIKKRRWHFALSRWLCAGRANGGGKMRSICFARPRPRCRKKRTLTSLTPPLFSPVSFTLSRSRFSAQKPTLPIAAVCCFCGGAVGERLKSALRHGARRTVERGREAGPSKERRKRTMGRTSTRRTSKRRKERRVERRVPVSRFPPSLSLLDVFCFEDAHVFLPR